MFTQQVVSNNMSQPGYGELPYRREGRAIYVSAQGPKSPYTGLTGDTIEQQTAQTLDNLKRVVEQAGASMTQVIRVTVYLSDMSLLDRVNGIYEYYFTDPKPMRSTLGSELNGVLIKIDAVAYVGN